MWHLKSATPNQVHNLSLHGKYMLIKGSNKWPRTNHKYFCKMTWVLDDIVCSKFDNQGGNLKHETVS